MWEEVADIQIKFHMCCDIFRLQLSGTIWMKEQSYNDLAHILEKNKNPNKRSQRENRELTLCCLLLTENFNLYERSLNAKRCAH